MHPRKILAPYGFAPRKSFGQHFLKDKNIVLKMMRAISPKRGNCLLEIGPGLGVMTELLANSGAKLVAVEKDRGLAGILRNGLAKKFKNLSVIEGDFLELSWKGLFGGGRKLIDVFGNIPYYITTPIIFSLIDHHSRIGRAFLTVQKELADRLVAQPGRKEYGRLTLAVRFFADIERLFNIPAHSFSPAPSVDSSFIVLKFHRRLPKGLDRKLFLELLRASFAHRRKNILNTLTDERVNRMDKEGIRELLKAGAIDPTKRPEELMMKDYVTLAMELKKRIS
ncbi:MAG: 16S rRNA (adenine(1518)-N(6)/adenine(1519)-N(6))-dimethyltransferase RsmA [Candidatus Omnitrophica bacterium]|nr:16S rRNA (adenine(1518)-N(6)/adenine(1519)-N(6))-dimethyltransferase RsmA [Candidatus Omnitrophota bacterium]